MIQSGMANGWKHSNETTLKYIWLITTIEQAIIRFSTSIARWKAQPHSMGFNANSVSWPQCYASPQWQPFPREQWLYYPWHGALEPSQVTGWTSCMCLLTTLQQHFDVSLLKYKPVPAYTLPYQHLNQREIKKYCIYFHNPACIVNDS